MRDFFYNKGDVFIAVLIILVAALVIYLRVGVIMDYSPTGEKGGSMLPSISEILDQVTGANTDEEDQPQIENDPPVNDTPATAEEQEPPAQTESPPVQADPQPDPPQDPQPENPPQAQPAEIQIVVSAGDAASVIADKLLAAGAITDKQAFISDVIAQGADSKLKVGTFTIPAGSSHSDIIKILIG